MCYNKGTKREGNTSKKKEIKIMKFRVYFKDNKYFSAYFYTKKEAIAFQNIYGGEIQRKVGCEWYGY